MGHSAIVELGLVVDGERLDIAQVGPKTFVLREPRDISASSTARLLITVDGQTDEQNILLPRGASRDTPFVEYVRAPEQSG